MSHVLINRNADLKKLRDEGYDVEVINAHLFVHGVPYVNSDGEIVRTGILTCPLLLAGEQTVPPTDHTVKFAGELPCDKDGNPLTGLVNQTETVTIEGKEFHHNFSAKPQGGNYDDFHHKMTTYVNILQGHAQAIDRTVTARTHNVRPSADPESPLHYPDTNSSRAEIDAISEKLKGQKIAIIGLGGTGSYVLDFVAKTWVQEIHLFDADDFLSHNALRAPGAASLDTLNGKPKKVAYLHGIYSGMHKNVIPHENHVTAEVLAELSAMTFVFICIDDGEAKKLIIQQLTESSIPYVDVGVGIEAVEGSLTGSVRITTATPEKSDHISQRISVANGADDDYSTNIQIAEINALNAALAVIKWKKLFGFYHDFENEHHAVYDINVNKIINDETTA